MTRAKFLPLVAFAALAALAVYGLLATTMKAAAREALVSAHRRELVRPPFLRAGRVTSPV